jgi:hypothetical protein
LPPNSARVDAGHEADRQADQRRQQNDLSAAHDGVGHAAAVSPGGFGSLVKKFQLSDLPPIVDQVAQDQEQDETVTTVQTPVSVSIT